MFTLLFFVIYSSFLQFGNCQNETENCDYKKGNIPVELFKLIINGNMFSAQFMATLAACPAFIEDLKFPCGCPHDIKAVAMKVDADGDGTLGLAEFKQLLTTVFANIVDQEPRDGCVTKKEREQFDQQCGGMAQGLLPSTTTPEN